MFAACTVIDVIIIAALFCREVNLYFGLGNLLVIVSTFGQLQIWMFQVTESTIEHLTRYLNITLNENDCP